MEPSLFLKSIPLTNNLLLFLLQEAPVDDINFGMLILRMFLFLGLVIGLIYFVLRKLLPYLMHLGAYRSQTVKILERTPIDQKRSLLVVEIQEKVYLIGSAEGQINVLMELDREKIGARPALPPKGSGIFDDILKKTLLKSKS